MARASAARMPPIDPTRCVSSRSGHVAPQAAKAASAEQQQALERAELLLRLIDGYYGEEYEEGGELIEHQMADWWDAI
jgi:hypothetical protein